MARRIKKEMVARVKGVKELSVSDVVPNPHNPRMLFDEAPMTVLRRSIEKVGILVPLTVYWEAKRGKYVILDGQRRWICAKRLGRPTIPVNEVDEPGLVENIVTMFQIHKLREDWELMPTALKLEVLMQELKERNERNLAALTGLDKAVVARCKKLLAYPKKYQNLMLDPDPDNRIKADFFIELYAVRNDRFVNDMEWFTKDKFTGAMLDRYKEKRLRSVTDFRVIKQHVSNARKAGKTREIERRLRRFAEDDSVPIDYLDIASASAIARSRTLTKSIVGLIEKIVEVDVDELAGEDEFWAQLLKLAQLARNKYLESGRRIRE